MEIKTYQAGFTMVEIMIVVAVVGLLAGIAVPNFIKSREQAQLDSVFNNLRLIDSCKDQWALEQNRGTGSSPGWTDIAQYLKGSTIKQVVGESYYIETVGTNAYAIANAKLGTYDGTAKISNQ